MLGRGRVFEAQAGSNEIATGVRDRPLCMDYDDLTDLRQIGGEKSHSTVLPI